MGMLANKLLIQPETTDFPHPKQSHRDIGHRLYVQGKSPKGLSPTKMGNFAKNTPEPFRNLCLLMEQYSSPFPERIHNGGRMGLMFQLVDALPCLEERIYQHIIPLFSLLPLLERSRQDQALALVQEEERLWT